MATEETRIRPANLIRYAIARQSRLLQLAMRRGGFVETKRWQDWLNVILGVWTVASPWVLDFVGDGTYAAPTAWILGAAIVIFAGSAVYMHKAWEEAISIILGICLFVSPWALGFADQRTPTTNAAIVGLFVTAFAVWAMVRETAVQKWWHDHYRVQR
jgi:hypothetical protein